MFDPTISVEIKGHSTREISKVKAVSEHVNDYRCLCASSLPELPRTVFADAIATTPILVRVTTPAATTRQAQFDTPTTTATFATVGPFPRTTFATLTRMSLSVVRTRCCRNNTGLAALPGLSKYGLYP